MNSIVRQSHRRRHNASSKRQARDARKPLDVLFALDRMVVEVSMQLFNVNDRDRARMRRENRQLHAAVRQHLPVLLKQGRPVSS